MSTTEAIWAGKFGDNYTDRNSQINPRRRIFWEEMIGQYKPESFLEVGCGTGGNLQHIDLDKTNIYGIEINRRALGALKEREPSINSLWGSIFDLPFKEFFDMVLTCGVLIHVRPKNLNKAIEELIRVSKHYILCMEYYAPQFVEIPYHNKKKVLFKGPYGDILKATGLTYIRSGYLGKERGFDRVNYWMFKK